MDTTLMLKYIREVLIPALGEGCLLMEEFSAHKTDAAILELIKNDINPVIIPGGYTDICQPLAINKPVKDYFEKHYQKWLEQAKPSDYTKGGNRRKPTYELVFECEQ